MNILIYGAGPLGVLISEKLNQFFDVEVYSPRTRQKKLFLNDKLIASKLINNLNFHKSYDLVILAIPGGDPLNNALPNIKRLGFLSNLLKSLVSI